MYKYILLFLLLSGIINSCNSVKKFINPRPKLKKVKDISLINTKDSIYIGKHSNGPVKVISKVTVIDHRITDIDIIEHRTGQGQAAESITDSIIKHQTICLDAISGATMSSKCILKSVEKALKNN